MTQSRAMVFVHGAFHGPWCWDAVVPRIEALGARCSCIELYRGGLEPDVDAVQAEVDRLRAEGFAVAVVGHSLGCSAVAGLDASRVAHVVFLAGPLQAPGLPDLQTKVAPTFFDAVDFAPDGVMTIDPEKAIALFYADCDADVARAAAGRLRPNLAYGAPDPADPPIWQATASTYLWCGEDAVVDPAYQRELAALARWSEGFDSSHSPMLSQPEQLAEALARVLERTPPEA